MAEETKTDGIPEGLSQDGLDRKSGELVEREMRQVARGMGPGSDDIRQAGYNLDELARQGYAEGQFRSPVMQAFFKLYLTLKDEGAGELLEKQAKAFDEQIRRHETLRDEYERDLDSINQRSDAVYGDICDLGTRIRQFENGIVFMKAKMGEMDSLVYAKRDTGKSRGAVDLSALSDDYHEKPVAALMREKRELETILDRAQDRLEPMYVDVKNRDIEHGDVEQSRRLLMIEKRRVSSEITELYRQKNHLNSGLVAIIRKQALNAKLAQESSRMVKANKGLNEAARQYMLDQFDTLFKRYELAGTDQGAPSRAEQELDDRLDRLTETAEIGYESDRSAAHTILNKYGIF